MSVIAIRNSIESWLSQNVRIDVWDLDAPSNVDTVYTTPTGDRIVLPANAAVYDPIADLQIEDIYIWGLFRYYITYRFERSLTKHQLPIKQLENLLQWILSVGANSFGCNKEVIDTIVKGTEYPLFIRRTEGENSDWLVTLQLPFFIKALNKPEFGAPGIEPPRVSSTWLLNRLQIDIWKRELPLGSGEDLDRTFVFESTTNSLFPVVL